LCHKNRLTSSSAEIQTHLNATGIIKDIPQLQSTKDGLKASELRSRVKSRDRVAGSVGPYPFEYTGPGRHTVHSSRVPYTSFKCLFGSYIQGVYK
jgi:hypothetical protein